VSIADPQLNMYFHNNQIRFKPSKIFNFVSLKMFKFFRREEERWIVVFRMVVDIPRI